MLESGATIARRVKWARDPLARTRGLIGQRRLEPGGALIIERGGGQVHTFGMRYALDVVFCDERWLVLHVVRGLRPRRMTRWVRGCRYVVELRAGALPQDLGAGNRLELRSVGTRDAG